MFIAFVFFVFYWNMTRFYIFNNKEVVIYFLALAGIYLINDLILAKKRDIKIELLLSIILGLNSFVNLHGILTGIFSLCILFIFSKLPFWQRIWQVVFIFCVNLFFSAFEFAQSFGFIFLNTFKKIFEMHDVSFKTLTGVNNLSGEQSLALQHINMYQTNNLREMYFKGKLQIITNIGSYGFYFLFFLAVLVVKFKEIRASSFGKMILLFMATYYLVIIDPFNINKNDLSIVLWGSPKYSMLVVFFSIIFIAVYFDSIIRLVFRFIYKNKLLISITAFVSAIFLYIFKSGVINLGLKILQDVVQINRDISFYANKLELFYYFIFNLTLFFGIVLIIFYFIKIAENIAYRFFLTLCLFFMIFPFFIVDVGKIPLAKTFSLVGESREFKLQNIIYFGDLFKVYYYAKNNLPEKTLIRSVFLEVYVYNDYFKMVERDNPEAKYEIAKNCLSNQRMLYVSGVYCLCQN